MRNLSDHDEPAQGPTIAVKAGKLTPVLRTHCEPLAGRSTLNCPEHTPPRNLHIEMRGEAVIEAEVTAIGARRSGWYRQTSPPSGSAEDRGSNDQ